jgi:DNA repair exonuclease SbcCD ATPase subunit
VNPLRNWIENWLFGDRLREVEARLREAGNYIEAIGESSDLYNELRERCADIETEYATDQALSDLSEKVDALGVDDLECELEDIKRRILEQKKQIQIMDKILADHLDRHNQPT